MKDKIRHKLDSLPSSPGVYLMKDRARGIIYIGKASSIKKRVSSYFHSSARDPKTRMLVKHIEDIDFIATDSEIEALLLENTLIKKHKPKYNIRLKDDKRYPYICVTLEEDYPRVIYTRKLAQNRNRYFGPYTDARAARNTISMINAIFKLKTCKRKIPLKPGERPCINYQINRCSGVCTGQITGQEYRSLVENAVQFLEGNIGPALESLHRKMEEYSSRMDFEKAAQVRDIIYDIQKTAENQKVHVPSGLDQDYITAVIQGPEAVLLLFEFRKGVLLGRKISVFAGADYSTRGGIVRSFILDFYQREDPPARIITDSRIEDREIIEAFLKNRSSRTVKIIPPVSHDDRGVMSLMNKNIDLIIAEREARLQSGDAEKGLEDLRKALDMDSRPDVIECFDISNLQGTFSVASMVQFRNGEPARSEYRRYKIRGYENQNDPGMIHEVVSRRLQHLVNEEQEIPDLMVIDGGTTQLGRALEAAANFSVPVKIISIAKRMEEIFTPESPEPLRLDAGSPALRIIQQVRDEAHRFAISYHRKLREKGATKSVLDSVPGLGHSARNALLAHFRSVENVKKASVEELEAMPGIGPKTAARIREFFKGRE